MTKQKPIKIVYNVSKTFKEVRHYKSVEPILNTNLLTSEINISKDRKFNNSRGVSYWIKIRHPKKWSKVISGLKSTKRPMLYYGDIPTVLNGRKIPKHLLVFRFVKVENSLTIYLYENYYPTTERELQIILSKHK